MNIEKIINDLKTNAGLSTPITDIIEALELMRNCDNCTSTQPLKCVGCNRSEFEYPNEKDKWETEEEYLR